MKAKTRMFGEIDIQEDKLDLLAERFALERGNRSARLARQLVDGLLSGRE